MSSEEPTKKDVLAVKPLMDKRKQDQAPTKALYDTNALVVRLHPLAVDTAIDHENGRACRFSPENRKGTRLGLTQ